MAAVHDRLSVAGRQEQEFKKQYIYTYNAMMERAVSDVTDQRLKLSMRRVISIEASGTGT